jgi:hypothetical protein
MCTFAGKTAINVAMSHQPAARRVRGWTIPAPPASSATPLAITTSRRREASASGTIASYIRGRRKWRLPAARKKTASSSWRRGMGG